MKLHWTGEWAKVVCLVGFIGALALVCRVADGLSLNSALELTLAALFAAVGVLGAGVAHLQGRLQQMETRQ